MNTSGVDLIKIFTVYFEGKYTPDYVSKLYYSLKRNCNVPFQFICLTDNKNVKADKIIMLPEWSDIKIHWHKLKFFSPLFGGQEPEDEIIVMDIDQIIVGDVTEMINWPVSNNEIVTYMKWWNWPTEKADPTPKLNGGWYKFKSGSLKFIWDEFSASGKSRSKWQNHYYNKGIVHYKYYGEQNYVEDCCKRNKVKITHMPGEWVCKLNSENSRNTRMQLQYTKLFEKEYMVLDEPHPAIKIVHFAGAEDKDTIHDYEDKFGWIKDNWHE